MTRLETPALMAEAVAGPFRGLTPTAPVADVDARIRRVAGGHLVIADVAVDSLIDIFLVLARRLSPHIDDLSDHLADIIVDLDSEAIAVDDLDEGDITYWCALYVDRTPIKPKTPRK